MTSVLTVRRQRKSHIKKKIVLFQLASMTGLL